MSRVSRPYGATTWAVVLSILVVMTSPSAISAQRAPSSVGFIEITPDGGAATVLPNSTGNRLDFNAVNRSVSTGVWTFTCSATGNVACTSVSPSSATLGPGQGTEVSVTFRANAAGTGKITLTSSGETGYYNITVVAPGPPTAVTLRNYSSDNWDRSECLATGAGESAYTQCGDLVVTHSMPGLTTMGRERALTLMYSSRTAHPRPIITAAVTEPVTAGLNTVNAQLIIGNVVQATATYSGWSKGTRQIAIAYNADTTQTGVYPFTLKIQNQYSASTFDATVTGNLVVVNRRGSPFGAGVALVGVERLFFQQDSSVLWVGGDGSARLYAVVGGQANTWAAPRGAYQDTLSYDGTEYTRRLRHGVTVTFDQQGKHIRTTNRAGQVTSFTYATNDSLLTGITVPPGGSSSTYTLAYTAGRKLDWIKDPANRLLDVNINAGLLATLKDPDIFTTTLGYDAMTNNLTSRTNRRGFTTVYEYQTGYRISKIKIPTGMLPTDTNMAVTGVTPWDTKGLASIAVDTSLVHTSIIGPRYPAVPDTAAIWVDRWGAPVTIVNAIGAKTKITRGDPLVPELVTQVTYPDPAGSGDGRIVKLSYNERGNLLQTRDSTWHLSASVRLPTKVTRYVYDTLTPDSPKLVIDSIDSGGRTTKFYYNSLDLTDSVIDTRKHKTSFGYATGALSGLVNRVTEHKVQTRFDSTGFTNDTAFALLDLVQSFDFDARGNLKTATAPDNVITSYVADQAGRITDIYDPLGFHRGYVYDPMNRVSQDVRYTAKTAHPGSVVPLANCRSSLVLCADSTRNVNVGFGAAVIDRYFYSGGGLDSTMDARGMKRRFKYDGRGLLRQEIDGYNHTRYATYDAAGNLIQAISRTIDTVRFRYDALNRKTSVAFDTVVTGEGVPPDSIGYIYDKVGNLLVTSNRNGSVTRTYYADGALKSKMADSFFDDSLFYRYDQTGARTYYSRTSAGVSDSITYVYDPVTGDLQTMNVMWGAPANVTRTLTFLWDTLGRRRQVTYPNNMTVKYRYDASGTVRRVLSSNPAAPADGDRFDFTFSADSVDAVERALRQGASCPNYKSPDISLGYPCGAAISIKWSNRYNRFGQLVFQNAGVPDSFDFDQAGNMSFHRVGTNKPHYYRMASGDNHLVADSIADDPVTKVVYSFVDYNLNRIQDTVLGTGNLRLFYYDALGRTSGIRDSEHNGTGRSTCLAYNSDGDIVRACDDAGNWLHYDGSNVAGVTSGTRTWSFVHGPGIDDPLVGLWRDRVHPTDYKEWYWVTDGRGRQLATGAGDGTLGGLIQEEYTVNGGTYAGGTQNANTFAADRFASPIAPGVSFFRNRVYDQGTGRWTQEDPLGVVAGLNLYQFNGNNPVAYTDPFGLLPSGCCTLALVDPGATMGSTPEMELEQFSKRLAASVTGLLASGALLPEGAGAEGIIAGTKAAVREGLGSLGLGKAVQSGVRGVLSSGKADQVMVQATEDGGATVIRYVEGKNTVSSAMYHYVIDRLGDVVGAAKQAYDKAGAILGTFKQY